MSSGFFPLDDGFDHHHHHHHSDFDDLINLEDLPFLLESSLFSPPPDVSLDSIFQDIPEQPNPIIPEEPNPIIPDANPVSQDPVPNPDPATNFIPIEQTTETLIPADTLSLEQIAQPALPYQQTQFPDPQNSSNFSNGFVSGDGFGTNGGQNVADVQGGYNCGPQFNGIPWRPCLQPSYPTFGAPPAFLGAGNSFMFDQFGRPYRTGGMQGGSFYRPTFVDDETPRLRRYNPEERKKKIERYREKRSQRNFGKTIKWLRAYQEFEGNLHASRRAKVRLGRLLLQTGVGTEKKLQYALDYLSWNM